MKIIKKAKLLPVGCHRCGCIFKPAMRNLESADGSRVKEIVSCPTCHSPNKAKFEISEVETE